jgi:hypothetical protein
MKPTITSREIQMAIKLMLPGELAKQAASEGTNAFTKLNAIVVRPNNHLVCLPTKPAC